MGKIWSDCSFAEFLFSSEESNDFFNEFILPLISTDAKAKILNFLVRQKKFRFYVFRKQRNVDLYILSRKSIKFQSELCPTSFALEMY